MYICWVYWNLWFVYWVLIICYTQITHTHFTICVACYIYIYIYRGMQDLGQSICLYVVHRSSICIDTWIVRVYWVILACTYIYVHSIITILYYEATFSSYIPLTFIIFWIPERLRNCDGIYLDLSRIYFILRMQYTGFGRREVVVRTGLKHVWNSVSELNCG